MAASKKKFPIGMLKSFFEPGGDKKIFDGLAISEERQLCEEYMGKYPVISISLKGLNASSYEVTLEMLARYLAGAFRELSFLLDSERLREADKTAFRAFLDVHMSEAAICSSLRLLSELLEIHYGQKVILLIDEYDVPLAKAFEQGYYDQMVLLIRNLFEQALKTNPALKFAVLTGCMRISKESIFTGLNNLQVLSVADAEFDEYFGFTDQEVRELLTYYGLESSYEKIRDWYDGYQFGNVSVYCPWDVICYCKKLMTAPDDPPQNYWINTSSNDIVRHFIQEAGTRSLQREIESLIAGETVTKVIRPELTYRDMYASVDNIWSVLYTTGYLTGRRISGQNSFRLSIPNMEIRSIFTSQIIKVTS